MSDSIDRMAFSPLEAAVLLGVHRLTVYRAIKSGQIKAARIRGRRVISRLEIERILDTAGAPAGVPKKRPKKIALIPAA